MVSLGMIMLKSGGTKPLTAEFDSVESAHAWADSQSTRHFQVEVEGRRVGVLQRRAPALYTSGGDVFVPFIPTWMDGPVSTDIRSMLG